jgi:hypothetical protein
MERHETRRETERRDRLVLDVQHGTIVIDGAERAEPLRSLDLQGQRLLALGEVLYSIRVPEPSGEVECGSCRTRFLAAGPTGYADDDPICDLCLLVASEDLGMVLALVAVVRAFAAPPYEKSRHYWAALAEVGSFGRIYERVAARSGPPRLMLTSVFHRPC